ncbi:hypothetical protein [Rhodococcus qingshengii]|uniref:hypothetical protein n=1 Tax=Rhodococcus qingshengii TaxID=334542 RepID=UPI0035DBDFDB
MTITELQAHLDTLEARNEELTGLVTEQMEMREAGEFSTAQLALENIGWQPLMGIADSANSFSLDQIKRSSELCRAVATVNPLVGRGLKVRAGYIWGPGVSIVPTKFFAGPGRPRTINTEPKIPEGLGDVLTNTIAQIELETTAACDGNLFFLVDTKTKTVQRIPLEEIEDGVSEQGNKERLLYIRRSWNDWELEMDMGDVEERPFTDPDASRHGRAWSAEMKDTGNISGMRYRTEWYPTMSTHMDKRVSRPRSISRFPVNYDKVIVHAAFNRMVGWRWGVPDILRAVWWTKAYKEYLENCSTLAKAYARFAWKVTSEKSRGVRRTAASLAQTPRTDPNTGQPLSVGASAVLGAGQDLSAVGGRGQVDFDGGRPLAAMIAAALDVPLPALTEDPSVGNRSAAESLDTSTKLVMQGRQKVMNEVYSNIFRLLGLGVRLRWPELSEEPVHRRLQAIDMGIRLGLFSEEEARAMVLDAWKDKWDDFPRSAPPPEKLPYLFRPDKEAGQSSEPRPGAPAPLKAGNRLGGRPPRQPDPMSAGDHELRDESGD